jgi:transglutaminase-like putative cysteine protease
MDSGCARASTIGNLQRNQDRRQVAMKIHIDVSMTYELGAERTALLALEPARIEGQVVTEETLEIGDAELRPIAGETGVGRRVWARLNSDIMRLRYRSRVDVLRPPVRLDGLAAAPMDALPPEQITFLRPSRYCQFDRLDAFAAEQFGRFSGGERVAAIMGWIAAEMEYAPGQSDSGTTLIETFETRKGVCRDFAHLLCGLLRASRIPARYVSAYGVSVDPPDFHAVVQVWLDNRWHLIDPTAMCSADELVLIGVGRDAADVPFMETPDEARLLDQQVRVSRL